MKRTFLVPSQLVAAVALFLVSALLMCTRKTEDMAHGGEELTDAGARGTFSDPGRYRKTERDGARRGKTERVVRVSRSCLSSLGDLLVSPFDWFIQTSHGIMVFPHSGSVLWRLGLRPNDVITTIGGVTLDAGEQLLVAASWLKANPSAPFEIRVLSADKTTLRIVVESAPSSCESFGELKLY